ncbi:MAG: LysR family transcriptional regulator [Castellaniella sp.]|uniref:LysR family transcriptional regulator n=1 Tax=Castellaniella sp. TaxID=1955812 RepID=UPI00120B8AA4|nr:LysR family transcriptional regulator [Castellaniella sp.]TAN25886.1 MAG: LysR family transcriptional regulator [Castellaniella sp.]
MDTRFLESFVKVVELGSIAGAARSLHLTPTAVSLRIKSLEEEVHERLIERAGRTVVPTDVGIKVLSRARLLLSEVDNFLSMASSNEFPAGPLTLGAIPSAMDSMLPAMLRRWTSRHPDISILLEPASSTILYQRVLDKDLDAAILTKPLFNLPKICDWQLLWTDTIVLLTPTDIGGQHPFDIIRQNPFIRYDRRVVGGKMVDDYLKAHNLEPNTQVELDGILHIANFVRNGLGVAILPSSAAYGIDGPSVRQHRLPGPTPTRSVGLLMLRSSIRKELVQEFRRVAL